MFDLAAARAVTYLPAAPDSGGGGDWLGWANGLTSDVESLGTAAARAVVVLLMVAAIWRAKFAIAGTLMAVGIAALLWWAIGSFKSEPVQDKFDGSVESSSVRVVPQDRGATLLDVGGEPTA